MPTKTPIEYHGKLYRSTRELVTAHGVDHGTFLSRNKRGLSLEECLRPADGLARFAITVNGIRYSSQKTACQHLGQNYSTVKARQRELNLCFEEAVLWAPSDDSIAKKCALAGVLRWTYWARRRRGWSEEQSLGLAPPPRVETSPRETALKFKYGLSFDEYERMLASHNGVCWICGDEPNPPCIDHDHKTGRIRGILCRGCNTAIGRMKDDPKRLRAAAAYLEASS
jgi:hypothetical protein